MALRVYKEILKNVRLLLCEYARDHHGQEQKRRLEKILTCNYVQYRAPNPLRPTTFFLHAFSLCKAKVQVVSYSLGLE